MPAEPNEPPSQDVTDRERSGDRRLSNCSPEFTALGIPVVDLETKLDYLKCCILDGNYEDAIGHLDDLRNSVHLRAVLRGMRPKDVTTEGEKSLRYTSLANTPEQPPAPTQNDDN